MTDEQRWTIYVCPGCGTVTDYDRSTGCGACEDGPMTVPVVVVPVSSVVPITRLREFVESERLYDATDDPGDLAHTKLLGRLSAFLDDLECASNPNNERTT